MRKLENNAELEVVHCRDCPLIAIAMMLAIYSLGI